MHAYLIREIRSYCDLDTQQTIWSVKHMLEKIVLNFLNVYTLCGENIMTKLLCLSILFVSLLMGCAYGQDLWSLGSQQDWLSTGTIYHVGSYYYPNYMSYTPFYYTNNYPIYYPIYNTYYYPQYYPTYYSSYYPRYYNNFEQFPLGTFGLIHGGNPPI